MARALLADPFLPRKVVENREDEIVKCLRCFTCMAERAATSTRRCTVNPLIGREIEGSDIIPAPEKKKVLVAGGGPGGGLAGCECAIHLGMEGKKVCLVEMRDELAPDANVRHRPLLLKEIEKYVTVYTGYKGLEVTADGILCEDKNGKKQLVPGKSVICALGQRSRIDTVAKLQDAAPFVRVNGDAAKVSTITNAVYWGYHAALDI